MGARKQAISVRIGATDLDKLRRLARRLGARDSDVIRAAIKALLAQWAPLHDASIRGRSLVPVLLENGPELFRYFELDTPRLESIINDGANEESRVDAADIELLALNAVQRSYFHWRFKQVNPPAARTDAAGGAEPDAESLEHTLRQYLYDKYVQRRNGGSDGKYGASPPRLRDAVS